MTEYEFSEEHDQIFEQFSYRIVAISGIILLGVGTSLIQFFNAVEVSNVLLAILWIIMAIIHVVLAIFFFKPYDNFIKITVTEGDDMTQFLTALSEMNLAFLVFLILDALIITVNILVDLEVL